MQFLYRKNRKTSIKSHDERCHFVLDADLKKKILIQLMMHKKSRLIPMPFQNIGKFQSECISLKHTIHNPLATLEEREGENENESSGICQRDIVIRMYKCVCRKLIHHILIRINLNVF